MCNQSEHAPTYLRSDFKKNIRYAVQSLIIQSILMLGEWNFFVYLCNRKCLLNITYSRWRLCKN